MKKGVIRARIFGDFRIESEKGVLTEQSLRSGKLIRLLSYILIYKEKAISSQNIMDIFWEDDSRNPAGVLKNLIYRLRSSLRALGEEEYICTLPNGGYQWNPAVEMVTDYDELKEIAAEIWAEPNVQSREILCRRVMDEYEDNVSSVLQEETWIMAQISGYRSLFIDVLETLCGIYDASGRWAELEELCRKGLKVDFFVEDVHCWMIKSLQKQMKFGLAKTHFKKVKRTYFENLGVQNIEKIQNALKGDYSDAFGGIRTETNMRNLVKELDEKSGQDGALFCEYPIFQQIYHMEQRRMKRIEVSKCVVLFTLKRRKIYDDLQNDKGMEDGAQVLEKVMRQCLRLGDLVTRYSVSQFIAFLTSCSYDDGERVANRIVDKFENVRQGDAHRFEVSFVLEKVKLSGGGVRLNRILAVQPRFKEPWGAPFFDRKNGCGFFLTVILVRMA